MKIHVLFFLIFVIQTNAKTSESNPLENGVVGNPQVECMEDRVKLTFRTEKPFHGRIFVKGMSNNDKCNSNFSATSGRPSVDFEIINGECNMRRSRKISPEERGIEQSITIIISFHDVFITKVDRAYRCTCFYMEADRVVTSKYDVSMIPTTDLIDTAKMPLCTYSVRRGSVNGAVANYATVGEPLFHVWQCDSDMFSMLVHSCFVDDGAGQDRKPLLDEHGCTIDPIIVPDLTYNHAANLAYTEVSAFKFADKVTTYFQCAVSTCMISEGMCEGKTPPRCGVNANAFTSFKRARRQLVNSESVKNPNSTNPRLGFDFTMDLSADKIVVFDLDDLKAENEAAAVDSHRRFAALNHKFVISKSSEVCLSQTIIFSFIFFLIIITIVAVFLIIYQIYRRNGFLLRKF